jgi:hypothetical protein
VTTGRSSGKIARGGSARSANRRAVGKPTGTCCWTSERRRQRDLCPGRRFGLRRSFPADQMNAVMASTALILVIGACKDEDELTAPCAYERTLRKRPAGAIYLLPMAGNGSAN